MWVFLKNFTWPWIGYVNLEMEMSISEEKSSKIMDYGFVSQMLIK